MSNQVIELQQIAEVLKDTPHFSRMGDNYLYAHFCNLDPEKPGKTLSFPYRLNCMSFIVIRHGSMMAEVDLKPYTIKSNTLLVVNPGSLLKLSEIDLARLDATMLFVSTTFLTDINIDLNALNIRSLIENRSPAVRLTRAEINKLLKYLEFLDLHTHDEETIFSKNVARSICAAIFYELLQINFMRINRETESDQGPQRRRSTYVHDFMRLVHLNYMRERSLAFYASQLFISPKYLTVLVKEATGRSATEWINEFVIIEAKNLLRYSGKNIQQVAYALNFPNQSAFGKYFKHLTGTSPTAYQKS